MSERLGEVAECLAAETCLFGIKAQVIGVAEHLFEEEAASSSRAGSMGPDGKRFDRQNEHMLKVPSSPASPSGEVGTS